MQKKLQEKTINVYRKFGFTGGIFALAIASPFCSAIEVNDPGDFDLAGLPYISNQVPKNARNDGKCTLVEAIALANWKNLQISQQPTYDCGEVNAGANTITFLGNYTITLVNRSIGQSAFEIASDISIIGPTTIDANKTNRIFGLGISKSKLRLSNKLILTKGYPKDGQGGGAAILVNSTDALLVVNDCSFQFNKVETSNNGIAGGGAINSVAVQSQNAKGEWISGTWIYNSDFLGNIATHGGAYYGAPMFVNFSNFSSNKATQIGGALYITKTDNRVQNIHSSVFDFNFVYHPYQGILDKGAFAGAVYTESQVKMTYNLFSKNTVKVDVVEKTDPKYGNLRDYDAAEASAGALYIAGAPPGSEIRATAFEENFAGAFGGSGGAIRLDTSAALVGVSILGNAAVEGHAIVANAIAGSPEEKIVIANSSIYYNGLSNVFPPGGAAASEYTSATLYTKKSMPVELRNSFVYSNTGPSTTLSTAKGTPANITLYNTAIAVPPDNFLFNCEGNIYDGGNNLQSTDMAYANSPLPKTTNCPLSIPLATNSSNFFTFQTSPISGGIGRNQMRTFNHHLAYPESGALSDMKGKGNPTVCNGPYVAGYTQNEKPRVGCDIGPVNLN